MYICIGIDRFVSH